MLCQKPLRAESKILFHARFQFSTDSRRVTLHTKLLARTQKNRADNLAELMLNGERLPTRFKNSDCHSGSSDFFVCLFHLFDAVGHQAQRLGQLQAQCRGDRT